MWTYRRPHSVIYCVEEQEFPQVYRTKGTSTELLQQRTIRAEGVAIVRPFYTMEQSETVFYIYSTSKNNTHYPLFYCVEIQKIHFRYTVPAAFGVNVLCQFLRLTA